MKAIHDGYNARGEVTLAKIQQWAASDTFAYDHAGNMVTESSYGYPQSYAYNSLNQRSSHSYDADGNATAIGAPRLSYDTENRLSTYLNYMGEIAISSAYDNLSRCANRVARSYNAQYYDAQYVYDGWNIIAEVATPRNASITATNLFVWGNDLSGTMHGAGGVGGLLATRMNGQWYFPLYDNNGNITAYLDANGAVEAEYCYDAFGKVLSYSGMDPQKFRHAFSAKWYDWHTTFYDYGRRFYNPRLMRRWLNRDPIEEDGGLNLYSFCGNDAVNGWDYLGMWKISRKGNAWAIAKAKKGDTFESLASLVELDTSDYKDWAHTQDDTPKCDSEYKIPNTIYFHHGIYGKWTERPIILDTRRNDNRVISIGSKILGFKVVWVNENVSANVVRSALSDEYLYQYYFSGHGFGQGELEAFNPETSKNVGVSPGRHTKHGINLLMLFACDSAGKKENSGKNGYYTYNEWEWNVATRGWFIGYEGETTLFNVGYVGRTVRGTNQKGVVSQ